MPIARYTYLFTTFTDCNCRCADSDTCHMLPSGCMKRWEHADVVLVLHRQLLAVVRECSMPFITDCNPQQTVERFKPVVPHRSSLPYSQSITEGPSSLSSTTCKGSGATAASQPSTNGNIGSLDETRSGTASSQCSDGSGSGSFSASLGVRRLELLWEDGEVGAVLTQQLHPSGELHLDVHCKGSHVWCERGSFCCTHHTLDKASEESVPAALHSSGGSPRMGTHQALISETPFVKHLDFIARKGVGGEACLQSSALNCVEMGNVSLEGDVRSHCLISSVSCEIHYCHDGCRVPIDESMRRPFVSAACRSEA